MTNRVGERCSCHRDAARLATSSSSTRKRTHATRTFFSAPRELHPLPPPLRGGDKGWRANCRLSLSPPGAGGPTATKLVHFPFPKGVKDGSLDRPQCCRRGRMVEWRG